MAEAPGSGGFIGAELGAGDSVFPVSGGDPAYEPAKGNQEPRLVSDEEAAFKPSYLAFQNMDNRWWAVQGWREAMRQFEMIYLGRGKAARAAYCAADTSLRQGAWLRRLRLESGIVLNRGN